MTLTVHLPDDLERQLRERAPREGRAVEDYVLHLIERDAAKSEGGLIVDASSLHLGKGISLSDAEFGHLLDALVAGPGLPHLPADFSRSESLRRSRLMTVLDWRSDAITLDEVERIAI